MIGVAFFAAFNGALLMWSRGCTSPPMLHYLRTYTRVPFIDLLTSACILGHGITAELMLALGVSPNLVLIGDEKFGGNDSLLQTAAAMGHIKVVIKLIRAGADKDYKNKQGHCALDLARIHGHRSIIFLLEG